MPGRPPNVPFFGWERYIFMFLCEKIVPVDMALGPQSQELLEVLLFHVSCSRGNSTSTADVVFLGPLA
jgi:hypothetical protein